MAFSRDIGHAQPSGTEDRRATASGLRHEALIYRDDEEFLAGTLPLIEEGIDAGEPVMVAVGEHRLGLLRDRLGGRAGAVEFANMTEIGRNPTRLISVWREFVGANRDARRLHGIGEPAWAGRDADELAECSHHEALLNRAFDDTPPFRLMCPYDASGLDGHVLAHAIRNHPWIVDADGTRRSDAYLEPELMPDPLVDPLSEPPPTVDRLAFAADTDLRHVREFVRGRARAAGLDSERTAEMVLALNELATNSLMHAGGTGELLTWERPGALVFEVQDRGRIADALVGRERPATAQEDGRGLWLVNELCDLLQVRSGDDGNRVRLWARTG